MAVVPACTAGVAVFMVEEGIEEEEKERASNSALNNLLPGGVLASTPDTLNRPV